MFGRALDNLAPWTDRAMFEHVNACSFRDNGHRDLSMVATATSLIERRVDKPFDISIKKLSVYNGATPVGAWLQTQIALGAEGDLSGICNEIVICNYTYEPGDVETLFKGLDNDFVKASPGWEVPAKSQAFLNQNLNCRIFINKENNAAIVIVDNLSMSGWHLLQSVIPTYVPNLFREIPLDEHEKKMLHALTGRNSANYIKELSELEKNYDIRNEKIKALLSDFEKKAREAQVQQIDYEISRIRQRLENLMEQYREQLGMMDDANIRYNGMKFAIDNADDGSALVEYIQANQAIDLISAHDTTLEFIVKTTYENFDRDEYETFRENVEFLRSFDVRGGVFESVENRRKFMDAIFLSDDIRIRLCAHFSVDIRTGVNRPIRGYDFGEKYNTYFPNYHLHTHSCLGGYESIINDYIRRGDTIGAISACVDSAKSINIAESDATFIPFMRSVFNSEKKCINLPDGRNVTPAEALAWLEEKEGADKE